MDAPTLAASGARGAFIEGWLLLFPKHHVTSLLRLPAAEAEGFGAQMERIRFAFERAYSLPLVAFEHGSPSVRSWRTGGCIEHAHMHCIPTAFLLADYLVSSFSYREYSDLAEALRAPPPMEPYLLCGMGDQRFAVFETGPLPSQWVRKVLAEWSREPDHWDWRTHPLPERVAAGLHKLKQELS